MKAVWEFEADNDALAALTSELSRCVLPLFSLNPLDPGATPEMAGTGFLVRAGEFAYLASAAHVFDFQQLVIYTGSQSPTSLSGRLFKSKVPKGQTRHDDQIDVAVLRLAPSLHPPFAAIDKDCIDLERLLANQHDRHGKTFLFVGYPETRSRPNRHRRTIESQVHSFRNVSASPRSYDRSGVSPLTHIVLPYGRKTSYTHGVGTRTPPDPHGFSGSPLFWLANDWRIVQTPPVVGVVVKGPPGLVVATDVGHVLEMILQDLLAPPT